MNNDNLIDIAYLERIQIEDIYHPSPDLLPNMKKYSLQAYRIGNTMFGCFVAVLKLPEQNKFEFQFFEFKFVGTAGEQKICPINIHEFSTILEICDPNYLDGLLFHINEIQDAVLYA